MSVLGVRCFKNAISYVVLDGTRSNPVIVEYGHLEMPAGGRPDQLVWLRKEVGEILHRSNPGAVSFKAAEPIAKTKDVERAEVEGVFQEASCALGYPPDRKVKKQIKADLEFGESARYLARALQGTPLEDLPKKVEEASLVALAALSNA